MNLYDIVFCISGDGNRWIGYVSEEFSNGEVIIRWWNMRTHKWHHTDRFDALDAGVIVVGPMPEEIIW